MALALVSVMLPQKDGKSVLARALESAKLDESVSQIKLSIPLSPLQHNDFVYPSFVLVYDS